MDCQIARRAVQNFVNQLAKVAGSGKALSGEVGKHGTMPAMMEGLEQRLVLAADLAFGAVSVGNLRALASGGGALSGSATIVNLGNTATGGFSYTAALSLDGIAGNEDDVLITAQPVPLESIAAGRNFRLNLNTLTIPAGLEPGAYRLVLRLDPSGAVVENSDTNNSFVSPSQSVVLNGPATNSNLSIRVTSRAVTITPDGQVPITTVITNRGAAINTPFTVTWTLSTDRIGGNAGDIELDSQVINALGANASQTIEINALLPVGTDVGQYFLIATVDGPDLGVIDESNESDNTFVSSSPLVRVILPDVSATFSTRSATVAPGQTITGSLTVRNQSATPTGSGFRVGIYLVPNNGTPGTQDLRIGTFDIPALAANGTFTLANVQIALPLSAPAFSNGVLNRVNPGTYSLAVVADDVDEIDEGSTGEDNNITTVSRVTITVPARGNDTAGSVDLSIGVRNASGSFVPGQSVDVQAVLNSLGNTFLQNGATVRFLLSSDNQLDENDLVMGLINVLGPIAPGSLLLTPSLTVPAEATSGRYFILAQVDPANSISETSETNNISVTTTAAITVARPTVSVRPAATSVNEANGNNARFTVTRTGARTEALTVNFTLSGTATAGSDFTAPSTLSVTIPAGAASAVIEIPVLGDSIGEGPETIALALASGSGYAVANTGNTATVTINDSAAVVSVRAVRASVAEGATGAAAGFTFARTGATTAAQVVRFTLTGTAVSGSDFTVPSGVTPVAGQAGQFEITIPAGAANVTANFVVTNDTLAETAETVIATVIANATNGYAIGAGAAGTATVTITDNEPVVRVVASDRTATEPVGTRVDTGAWTFTRTGGDLSAPLVVRFQLGGNARFGTGEDFVLSSNATAVVGSPSLYQVTIPAGQTRAVVTLTALADTEGEAAETAIVVPQTADTYTLAGDESATVTIIDAAPQIRLAVTDASVVESGTATPFSAGNFGRVTLTRTGETAGALTIPVDIESTGTYGAAGDYLFVINGGAPLTSLPTSVTFAAGSRTVTIDLIALNDALVEGPDSVGLTFGDEGNYTFVDGNNGVELLIADNATTVSVRAVDASAAETNQGQAVNNAIVEFTRTGATTAPLTVRFQVAEGDDDLTITGPEGIAVTPVVGQEGVFQFTIPAGASRVRLTVAAVNDNFGEDLEEFAFSVLSVPGTYAASVPPGGEAVVRVTDNDLARVRVEVVNDEVGEVGAEDLATQTRVVISRDGGNLSRPLLVQLNVAGTAVNGTDYQLFPIAVTIPAGAGFVEVPLSVIDDGISEGRETIVLSVVVNEDSNYTSGSEPVTISIEDDELPRVSIVTTDSSAAEIFGGGAANGGLFTLTRVGGNLQDSLTVNISIAGTATNGSDYSTIGSTVTFAAGSATATVPVTILDDAVVDAGETVIVTVAPGTGYIAQTSVDQPPVTIVDNEAPRVTITATDGSAIENANPANPGVFTFTRTGGNVNDPLTLNITITGTATNGTDYTTINSTVVIPANQTSVEVNIAALNDSLVEGNETVILTLAASSNYTIDGAGSATVTVGDDDVSTVTIAGTRSAIENAAAVNRVGQFTVTRTGGNLTQALTVRYSIQGTATQGVDFQTLTGEIVIPANQTSAIINVTALDDSIVDPLETVQLQLLGSTTGAYNVGETASAAIGITDDDGSVVTVAATDGQAAEVTAPGTANGGLLTFTRTGGNVADALTVTIAISGTATNGVDFATIPTTVTFAPGSATATVQLTVIDDATTEASEVVEVEIVQPEQGGYTAGTQRTASVTIADNDVPEIRVTVEDAQAAEVVTGSAANGGRFVFTRIGDLSQSLVVNVAVTGSATAGSDYETVLQTVTFAAGSASASLSINVLDDNVAEFAETVIVTIQPSGGGSGTYSVGSNDTATVTIADNEPPQVTVATTDPNAAEVAFPGSANGGLYTFTRVGGVLSQELTITIAVTGTATNGVDVETIPTTVTFAAGSATATLPVLVLDDSGLDSSETVIVTIQPSGTNAYTVGTANTGTVTIADDEQAVDFGLSNLSASLQNYTPGTVQGASFLLSYAVFSGNQNPRNARVEYWASLDGTLNPITDVLIDSSEGTFASGVTNFSLGIPLPNLAAGSYTLIMRILPVVAGDVDTQPANNIVVSNPGVIEVSEI